MSTVRQYRELQQAYDYFNKRLFGGKLPPVLVTMQSRPKVNGYFWANQFQSRNEDKIVLHELAMNPVTFSERTDEMILSTLVHEMVHVWQETFGRPGRRGYHNKQWAGKMKEVGLYPSDTGKPGGKERGDSMSHYIVANGAYQRAYLRLLASGFKLDWQARGRLQGSGRGDRIKFTCPNCDLKAWAKPSAMLMCGFCHEKMSGSSI